MVATNVRIRPRSAGAGVYLNLVPVPSWATLIVECVSGLVYRMTPRGTSVPPVTVAVNLMIWPTCAMVLDLVTVMTGSPTSACVGVGRAINKLDATIISSNSFLSISGNERWV